MMKNRAIGNSVPGFVDCGKDPVVKIYKDDGYSRMLIVNPDGHRSGDNRPAIVWIHGGGWMAGCPEQYIAHCRWTAWRGAVGIAISYTLLQNPDCHTSFIKGPSISDCLDDCRAAIKYIRKNAVQLGIDPDKIVVVGDSAGGHLALCLGVNDGPEDSKPDAVINCNGINDMLSENWMKFIKPGNSKEDQIEMAKSLSPLYNLKKGQGPILTMNGGKDHVVKAENSETFHKKCLSVGIDSEYILWPEARHAFIVVKYTATDEQVNQAICAIDKFLVRHEILDKKK